MIIDIRRAIESLVPDAKWDFSITNEGGTELQYSNIRWEDSRQKPSWETLVAIADGFAATDILSMRQSMRVGPFQLRRALRQLGIYQPLMDWIAAQGEEIQEAWEYATSFDRLDPFVVEATTGLGKTDDEIDQIFQLAVAL